MPQPITKYGDTGHILQQKGLKIQIVEGQPIAIRRKIAPVYCYYNREQITTAQFSAAKHLYECYITGWVGFGSYGYGWFCCFAVRV